MEKITWRGPSSFIVYSTSSVVSVTKSGRIDGEGCIARMAEKGCMYNFSRGTRRDYNLRGTSYRWENNFEGDPKAGAGGRGGRDIACMAKIRDHCESDDDTSRFINCREFN